MDEKLKDMDVMPVKEKGSNKLKIADKDGKSKTVKPEDGDNSDPAADFCHPTKRSRLKKSHDNPQK
jgi:hypothetical protein